MVTDVGATSLYGQLLDDAEQKRQLSLQHVQELLIAGLRATLPSPGKEAWIHTMVREIERESVMQVMQMESERGRIRGK